MKATVTYKMQFLPHPWIARLRDGGVRAWCLVKVVTPEHGATTEEAVAIFDMDSEAETFQGYIYAAGLDNRLVALDEDMRELLELRARAKRS